MLNDNFVHADLHPGNILVRITNGDQQFAQLQDIKQLTDPVTQIIILDCGLVSELDTHERESFILLLAAVAAKNGKKGAKLMIERAQENNCLDPAKFEEEMDALFTTISKQPLGQVRIGMALGNILNLVRKYQVKIDSHFATLIVGIIVLEGLGRQLNPDLNLLQEALPYLYKIPEAAQILKEYAKSKFE